MEKYEREKERNILTLDQLYSLSCFALKDFHTFKGEVKLKEIDDGSGCTSPLDISTAVYVFLFVPINRKMAKCSFHHGVMVFQMFFFGDYLEVVLFSLPDSNIPYRSTTR